MKSDVSEKDIPLVVDLDGTFIKTDLLYEGMKLLLRKNMRYFFLACLWILRGKIHFKYKVFEHVKVPADTLPFNNDVLEFVKTESGKGRKIILATASLVSNAKEVAKLYSLFSEVYGTDKKVNLKGKNKLKLLIELFGFGNFDYIGNSHSDLIIFKSCRYAYLVDPSKSLERKANKISNVRHVWHLHN